MEAPSVRFLGIIGCGLRFHLWRCRRDGIQG
nr:MAG TPA: hypothetical protein [Caudoviricetes sp.]